MMTSRTKGIPDDVTFDVTVRLDCIASDVIVCRDDVAQATLRDSPPPR